MFAKKGPKIIHEKDTFCQARGQWSSRCRIVVSNLSCGRSNPGSNPGHGTMEERKPFLSFSLKITQSLHASSEFDPETSNIPAFSPQSTNSQASCHQPIPFAPLQTPCLC